MTEDLSKEDKAVEAFKQRVREKAKELQDDKQLVCQKDFPVIGQEFELKYTTADGRGVQRVVKLVYVDEGKGRMSFEFT